MKKLALILMSALLIASMASCSDKEAKDKDAINSDPTASITEFIEVPYQFDLTPYIDISREDYVGVEIDKISIEVTDEEVNTAIYADLLANATYADVTDRGAEMGDTLVIDFKGFVDGVEFEGGTAKGHEMVLGQAGFIEGFEEALVGHKVGEEFVIDVTFPENYPNNEELSGKDAQFAINMKSVKEAVLPELNDSFVKDKLGFDTVEAYLVSVQEELVEQKALESEDMVKSLAFEAVYENVEVKDYPEEQYDYYYNDFVSYYEDIAKNYYNMDLVTYITDACKSTEEEFYSYADINAKTIVEQELIFFSIANQEKLWQDLTKGDYDAHLENLAKLYETDVATFEETYGASEVWKSLIWEKAIEFVVDNAVEVEPTTEESTEVTE
ncbi:MAG: trigger factor [Clostridia bacterium]|nr:trigger factor [Clostridia bacterium]